MPTMPHMRFNISRSSKGFQKRRAQLLTRIADHRILNNYCGLRQGQAESLTRPVVSRFSTSCRGFSFRAIASPDPAPRRLLAVPHCPRIAGRVACDHLSSNRRRHCRFIPSAASDEFELPNAPASIAVGCLRKPVCGCSLWCSLTLSRIAQLLS